MFASAIICLVVGVAHGDTLTPRCGQLGQYEQIKVRLSAIDAPERRQRGRSRQALAELCFGKQAEIRTVAIARYRRSVADVECAGKDAGAAIVRAGMAWVYDAYAVKYSKLHSLQATAQARRIGLWVDQGPKPPWEWRKERRGRTRCRCFSEPASAMRSDSRLSRMLHVLMHMAQHEQAYTSEQIGRMLQTNAVVVRRTMAGLKKAGFVTSE